MSVLTDGQTERRKHGTNFITSTADTGGKNVFIFSLLFNQLFFLIPYDYHYGPLHTVQLTFYLPNMNNHLEGIYANEHGVIVTGRELQR